MGRMIWLALVVAWIVLAFPLAVIAGRVVKLRDERG